MLLERLLSFPFFVIALMVHEIAHAFVADRLGDPTPRAEGRLSLNPLKHLDPLGTLLILLFGFGWAKPVVFDPYNLKNPRRDGAIIAAAGPLSNLLFAGLLSLVLHLFHLTGIASDMVAIVLQVNVVLAVFNLIPVYPLDGEKLLEGLLPRDLAYEFASIMNRYGILILLFLLLPLTGESPITALMSPVVNFFLKLFLG